ncbi:MAG: hypothetical protein GQ576_07010 [Methanococcoides sp.]|nr:hypothetical protein [Methanococcoides sp.]
MVSKRNKAAKSMKNKKDKDILIECTITRGKKSQTIRSTNPDYVVRQLKKGY